MIFLILKTIAGLAVAWLGYTATMQLTEPNDGRETFANPENPAQP